MIEIKDLFGDIKQEDYKVHLAIGGRGQDNEAPLRAFVRNEFKEWQEDQSRRNFEKKYIFSLIYYKKDEWMLVSKLNPIIRGWANYYCYSSAKEMFIQ